MVFDGELLEAEGPPLPGRTERTDFYLIRSRGRNPRIVTVLEPHTAQPTVKAVRIRGEAVEVETTAGVDRHRPGSADWTVETGKAPIVLRGAREMPAPFKPMVEIDAPTPVTAAAFRVAATPALDGTLAGFEQEEPLQLSLEDQYRRSEDAYPGPEDLSATAYAAWDETALYLAVEVSKPDLCLRPPDAAPLQLDNEPDDIHSDGLQVYIASARTTTNGSSDAVGYLVVPQANGRGVRVSVTSDTRGTATPSAVRGGWERTDAGYRVTLAIPWPPAEGLHPHAGARTRFDLIVNELLPGRMRRSAQLVWSGGSGWVWLRGDRQDPSRFGVLELVG
jgi:hypothetical protein